MADEAYIQAKIYYGYGKAAQRLGLLSEAYHALSPISPIVPGNSIGNLFVAFTNSWNYLQTEKYGSPSWITIADGRAAPDSVGFVVGDYFVEGSSTYFVTSKSSLQPIVSAYCNKVITITRATQDNDPGFNGSYSGYLPATSTILASNLPVSIITQSQGRNNNQALPTDTLLPRWTLLAPDLGGVIYKNRDIVEDEEAFRYVIVSPELTDLGWRMGLELLGT